MSTLADLLLGLATPLLLAAPAKAAKKAVKKVAPKKKVVKKPVKKVATKKKVVKKVVAEEPFVPPPPPIAPPAEPNPAP